MLVLFSAVILLLAVTVYAQLRIAAYTLGAGKILFTRLMLLVVGLGFGWVISSVAASETTRLLIVLAGLGLVHVPAAVILLIKGRRGAGKT